MEIIIGINEVKPGVVQVQTNGKATGTLLETNLSKKIMAAVVSAMRAEMTAKSVIESRSKLEGIANTAMAAEWKEYAEVYPGASKEQMDELQQTFYAGALIMFKLTNAIAASDLTEREQTQRLEELRVEVLSFLNARNDVLQRDRATSQN